MCLIIHKPPGVRIPRELLTAAVRLNGDGWGLMGHDLAGRRLLERHAVIHLDELLRAEEEFAHAEYALHLRRRTRGRVDLDNTHPFEIDEGVYLMHNGTLNVEGGASGESDTRSFALNILRPLARRYAGLMVDREFLRLLEVGLSPHNKIVLYDFPRRRFDVLNRHTGAEFEGLWLSSIKWIDAAVLPLSQRGAAQQRTYSASEVRFL
ncbi:MAG: class II glutamine amidotransferase [Panacagrimonas sp.]